MLQLLMRLRPWLPAGFWRALRDAYWRQHWQREDREQRKQFGPDAPSVARGERALLAERIADCFPFESALEVGCAQGVNLAILAPYLPAVRFVGVDRDRQSVDAGNSALRELGIRNAEIVYGDAKKLAQFPDKSFDVVFCSALFLFLGPDEIDAALGEMLRVARRTVILVEQHDEGTAPAGTLTPGPRGSYWIRDYRALLARHVASERISIVRIHSPVWIDERWRELAHLIEIGQKPSSCRQ